MTSTTFRILPALPPHDDPRCIGLPKDQRCGGKTSKAELEFAMQLLNDFYDLPIDQDSRDRRVALVKQIIPRRLCNNQHRSWLGDDELHAKAEDYESCLLSKPRPALPTLPTPAFEIYTSSKFDLKTKLKRILDDQLGPGVVYILRLRGAPDYIKIGHSCDIAERLKKLSNCYSGLRLCFALEFEFPKRMEEIIHGRLQEFRYRHKCLAKCKSDSHTEWFKMRLQDAMSTLLRLKEIDDFEKLWTPEAKLTKSWEDLINDGVTDLEQYMWELPIKKTAPPAKNEEDLCQDFSVLTVSKEG